MGSKLNEDQPFGAAEEISTHKPIFHKGFSDGEAMTFTNSSLIDRSENGVVKANIDEARVNVPAAEKIRRKTYSSKYKLQVIRKLETLAPNERGAYLRKEGLYYSMVARWRDEFAKVPEVQQVVPKEDTRALKRKIEQLERRLEKADAVIDLQKKVLTLLDTLREP